MMERAKRSVDSALLMEQYRALLETVDVLPLEVSGSSMTPFLAPGRDSVLLAKPGETLRRGDIALYQRESGAYVMHRVYRRERDGSYTMLGDAQRAFERGIRREQILAVACAAVRKGKEQKPGCFWWDFFARVWISVVPLRPVLRGLYGKTFGRRKR